MAYAVLCSLAQTIDQILNHDEYPISVEGKQQIASLLEQVIFLKEFLERFPQETDSLETRISDAANEAEDVIEHFMYEHTRSHYRSAAATEEDARPTNHLYDFRALKMVMEEINSIALETAGIRTENATLSAPSSSSTPTAAVHGVTVGLDKDLEKMKDLVCGDSFKRQIIPITGMGGIGKTTLAKIVYHDQLILEQFPVRAWVTVSQDYKTENIFANLLYSLQKIVGEGPGSSSDSTEDKVYKILTVRKYLIVLDDLWSERAWNDIRRAFPDSSNGSRIVITTRIESVASQVDSSSPLHRMRFMDPDQSWDLLKQKVFPNKDCPSDLEDIGKAIARSCGGLPLAIVLVAGILSTMSETRFSWEELGKKVHSSVDEEEGHFENIISLSYTHLPHHLRPCFLYMGGFPEHYEIRVSKLIKLWIAEGFVKQEEEAEEYLNNLVKRSLALVTTLKTNGKIKSCNVHDLVRDLCKRKCLDENYERRLSLADPDLTRLARAYASTLRSVISFQPNESSLGGIRKFRLLRVLDVVDTDAYSLPAPVFELFHLRYLAFSCLMEIPTAISRLQNLRTLIIRPSKRLRHNSQSALYLPLEIWMMPLLTHLVSFFDILPNPKGAASALENLLTLSVVKYFICTEEMMAMIPNVKKLAITYSGNGYQLQNLVFLHQLEKLTLVVKPNRSVPVGKEPPVFPKTLRKLTLSGWRFPWMYMKGVGSLPKLQVLKLRDHAFEGNRWIIYPEQFPSLEFLHIDGSNMRQCVTKKSLFPKLKHLVLYRCPLLSKLSDDMGEITTLELIEVDYANESLVECVKQIQKNQKDCGNDSLQVRRVHYTVG